MQLHHEVYHLTIYTVYREVYAQIVDSKFLYTVLNKFDMNDDKSLGQQSSWILKIFGDKIQILVHTLLPSECLVKNRHPC